MKGSFGLNRLVRKAQNLERKLEYDLVKTGATSIETYKNRCLGYIERLGMLTNVSMADKKEAARRCIRFTLIFKTLKVQKRRATWKYH